MHDLHVADKIFKLIVLNAVTAKIKQVKKIVIELGSVIEHGADISLENLDFNLRMLGRGLFPKDIEITINKVPGNDWKLVSISGD